MSYFKISALTFLFFFTYFASAFSQTSLTPAQLKEYNKQKLSLDLKGIGMGSYGSGSISYSSWTKWDAYQGFENISESELYTIAGYEDLAIKAKKREKRGKIFLWTGLGLMGGGLALLKNNPKIGALTALSGVVIGYISIGINTSNMKPYGVVTGITDEYNLQLSFTIKRNF